MRASDQGVRGASQALEAALPSGAVLVQPVEVSAYGYDASYAKGRPEVVAFPSSTAEVVAVMKIASEYRVPVFVRGAGTGLVGGAVARGGIQLVTVRMRDIEVDTASLYAEVGAGVTTEGLKQRVAKDGLFYPPDPGSGHVSTIGGNLATNAGGSRTLRWGTTRSYVLGLTVVLADGSVLRTGGRTTKNQSGYDLTNLFVGSEGTLGVICEARLRLVPQPVEASATIVLGFDTTQAMVDAAIVLLHAPGSPTSVEMIDQNCLRVLSDEERPLLSQDLAGVLLVRVDTPPSNLTAAVDDLVQRVHPLAPAIVRVARDRAEQEAVWRVRERISPAVARWKPTKISEDATVPIGRLGEFLRRLEQIRAKFAVDLLVFGHMGDGNLHPNFICDANDAEEMTRVHAAIKELFEAAIACGGTLSGEHGIGLLKVPFMRDLHAEPALRAMRSIKEALDPAGLLNPGKMLPAPEEAP